MSGDSVTPELATCLLAQAQSLWLVLVNDVYQAFACANRTVNPSPASFAIKEYVLPRGVYVSCVTVGTLFVGFHIETLPSYMTTLGTANGITGLVSSSPSKTITYETSCRTHCYSSVGCSLYISFFEKNLTVFTMTVIINRINNKNARRVVKTLGT